MLSKTIQNKNHIFSICQKSGDIAQNTVFKSVKIADNGIITEKLASKKIICCGNVSDDEKVFRTEDGRYYFSVCDGWGNDSDMLYGLRTHIFHDFGHPTTFEDALVECDLKPKYTTWGGAMAYHAKKGHLDVLKRIIKSIMEKEVSI